MSYQQHFPLTYLTSLFPSFPPSNSNHHSPPSLAGSNSLSSIVCKGPLLSSLRRALIRSATLNKEGKTERERGGGRQRKWYGKTEQRWRRSGVNQSGARGCKGPWLGCVWSVSFKGGTAGRAITDDLPLAAGPGATLTESNHKQVNSTSTFLIFFSPVSFFWSRSVYLDETLLFPLPPPPPFPLFWKTERSQVHFQCLFNLPIVWLLWS